MHFFRKKDDNSTYIETIILEQYNQYYRLAYSYVHNEDDAGDIVQNGAYRALRHAHTLKKTEYAQTWVYRIMLNECFRYLKQKQCLSYEKLQEENGIEAGCEEDKYMDIDLQRAVDMLPEKEKAIIILKFYEDKKLEEIAEILDENVNTVKSRLYRSLQKLKAVLTDGQDNKR